MTGSTLTGAPEGGQLDCPASTAASRAPGGARVSGRGQCGAGRALDVKVATSADGAPVRPAGRDEWRPAHRPERPLRFRVRGHAAAQRVRRAPVLEELRSGTSAYACHHSRERAAPVEAGAAQTVTLDTGPCWPERLAMTGSPEAGSRLHGGRRAVRPGRFEEKTSSHGPPSLPDRRLVRRGAGLLVPDNPAGALVVRLEADAHRCVHPGRAAVLVIRTAGGPGERTAGKASTRWLLASSATPSRPAGTLCWTRASCSPSRPPGAERRGAVDRPGQRPLQGRRPLPGPVDERDHHRRRRARERQRSRGRQRQRLRRRFPSRSPARSRRGTCSISRSATGTATTTPTARG